MAKYCLVCGTKFGLLGPGAVILLDGMVCKDCWKKAGFGTSINELMAARNYISETIKQKIDEKSGQPKSSTVDTPSIPKPVPLTEESKIFRSKFVDKYKFDPFTLDIKIELATINRNEVWLLCLNNVSFLPLEKSDLNKYREILSSLYLPKNQKDFDWKDFDNRIITPNDIIRVDFDETFDSHSYGGQKSSLLGTAVTESVFGTAAAINHNESKSKGLTFSYKNYEACIYVDSVKYGYGEIKLSEKAILPEHEYSQTIKYIQKLSKQPLNVQSNKQQEFSVVEEITKAKNLLDNGIITEEEFNQIKAKLIK